MSFFFIDDASAPTSITYVGTATSTGSTITIPGTAAAGDIAVLYDQVTNGSSGTLPPLVTPSGWANRVDESNSVQTRFAVHTKILISSDPSAVITGMVGDTEMNKLILVFRPDVVASALTSSTFTHELTNNDASSQSIAASGSTPPVIVLGGCGRIGATSCAFSTASPAFDGEILSSSGNQRIGYKFYNAGSTPASHTIDIPDLGSRSTLWGGYLTVT